MRIDVAAIDGGVEVTLTDYDVEPFDVDARAGRRHRRADRGAPARRAGVAPDPAAWWTRSSTGTRTRRGESRITFRKTARRRRRARDRRRARLGEGDAGDRLWARTARSSWPAGSTRRRRRPRRRSSTGRPGVVTLDCRGLEYISSAGLGVLLKTHKRLLGVGRQAPARRASGPHLQGHLHLLGFDQLFEIERPARRSTRLTRPTFPARPRCNCGQRGRRGRWSSATGTATARRSRRWWSATSDRSTTPRGGCSATPRTRATSRRSCS